MYVCIYLGSPASIGVDIGAVVNTVVKDDTMMRFPVGRYLVVASTNERFLKFHGYLFARIVGRITRLSSVRQFYNFNLSETNSSVF